MQVLGRRSQIAQIPVIKQQQLRAWPDLIPERALASCQAQHRMTSGVQEGVREEPSLVHHIDV